MNERTRKARKRLVIGMRDHRAYSEIARKRRQEERERERWERGIPIMRALHLAGVTEVGRDREDRYQRTIHGQSADLVVLRARLPFRVHSLADAYTCAQIAVETARAMRRAE